MPTPIVSFETLSRVFEGAEASLAESAKGATAEDARLLERFEFGLQLNLEAFERERRRLEAEGRPADGVMWSADDRGLSLLQSTIAAYGADIGALEQDQVKYDELDPRWAKFLAVRFGELFRDDAPWRTRRLDDLVTTIADEGTVVLLSDWGSGRYGAEAMRPTIEGLAGPVPAIVHLGDVYYAGTPSEMQENFWAPWPRRADALDRALNANHEMYSGGRAYFDYVDKFRQGHSYFALQNRHLTLIGLDTAYTDHDLHGNQLEWLEHVIRQAGERKVILLSHHQLFNRTGRVPGALRMRLASMLAARRIDAWFWGHQHHCTLYQPDAEWGLRARCIGHGGFPYWRVDAGDAGSETHGHGSVWHRFEGRAGRPGGITLGDDNPALGSKRQRYGATGFCTLTFDGPKIVERYLRPAGEVLIERELFD